MNQASIRLKCLELTDPKVYSPAVDEWIAKAKVLEAYVMAGGPSQADPRERQTSHPNHPAGQSRKGPSRS
jgi:hypothetical protein